MQAVRQGKKKESSREAGPQGPNKKATPLIQNQMNVSGMFVKQTCHYLSQFEGVSVSSYTRACNSVIYNCQSTDLTNAGPRLDVINSFIYNDCVAINSFVRWV